MEAKTTSEYSLANAISVRDAGLALVCLAGHRVSLLIARTAMKRLMPTTYGQLRQDQGSRFQAYFVFIVGIVWTTMSAPICLGAFVFTPADTDQTGGHSQMSAMEKICLSSRGALWISELPRLSYSSEYLVHHILSLSSLAIILFNNLPRRPLYLIYAGLITELLSDTVALLRFRGKNHKNSRLYAQLTVINALSLLILRALPAITVTLSVLMPVKRISELNYIASVVFYCVWLIRLAFKQLSTQGVVQLVLVRPGYIRIGQRTRITLYRLMLSVAIVAAQVVTAAVYCAPRDMLLSGIETHDLIIAGLGTVIAGLFGAKAINTLMMAIDGSPSTALHSHPLAQRTSPNSDSVCTSLVRTFDPDSCTVSFCKMFGVPFLDTLSLNGISIQGSILFSALWVSQIHHIAPTVARDVLLASMALALLLGEAIGRIGCYFGGCCGTRPDKNRVDKIPSVQILTSVLNMIAFFGLVTALDCGLMSLPEMGCTAMAVNAAIRLVVDRLRNDAMDKSLGSTTIFAGCQLFLSSWAYSSVRLSYDREVSFAIKATAYMMGTSLIFAVSGRALWLTLAQSPIRTKISLLLKPIVLVYSFSLAIVLLSIADAKDQSTAEGSMLVNDTQWGVLSYPRLLLSVLLTGIVPVLVS
ncbi:prolipoprotein diacylglyceryl transferase domain-containing protein [Trichoderma breve]|uniref:Prolipoprotein diacylglyceryl transferase domain-containing protein n=1 Tax=Trichoderma breve TaxID=2034170 RepID=A0A9W9E2S3_9HYPO|nr:prolipoprotein diacylglyceryl transferase domain-containing protein [Trichoderma breve]KAJ4856773.1 prolipoprotein diacylglyceryl transferase domain-containing protein [Trichoderma breve]